MYKLLRGAWQNPRQSTGFTLIELIVSMGIFSIVLTLAIGAFLIALDAQRVTIARQGVASNTRFALEFMSRQMRVAKESDGTCGPSDKFFEPLGAEGNDIHFINAQDTCVRFFLSNGAIVTDLIDPGGSASNLTDSTSMTVESLQFILSDGSDIQPRVTIVIAAHGKGSEQAEAATITIQTTISPRELDTDT